MALNLIPTKLMVPRPSQSVVERSRLHQQLEAGLNGKLILVSAPAGAGKSTLLGTWLRGLNRPTAWLSLDAGDNDLERFLLYLVSALQQVEPRIGSGLPELLQNQTLIEVEPLIIRLINDLAHWDQDILLVLDDYHLLTNEKIHNAVEFLLDHLPSKTCLIIATRSDPPLALARLRVRRQLLEIRAEGLRFSLSETSTFLNERLGLELSSGAITSLEERTEGWIAGLQLAALSLKGRKDKETFVQAFAGSHHYLVDYLIDEVLSRQTPEARQFLERTSILERFTAPLCQVVTGQPEPQKVLEHLDHANLFLIPLDDERKWYRYHHLFAEFLRHRLRSDEPELMLQLHQRASTWFEAEGWLDEAIFHALAADDFERAARLVEGVAFRLTSHWNYTRLIKYVQKLPPTLLSHYPRLCIYYGWALTTTGQLDTLRRVLPTIESSEAYSQEPCTVASYLVSMRAYEALRRLDFASGIRLCQEALHLLEPAAKEPMPSFEAQWLLLSTTKLMAYGLWHSEPKRADELYPKALALCQKFGVFVTIVSCFARMGRVKHLLGQLDKAHDLCKQGFVTLEGWQNANRLSGGVVNSGELHLSMAKLLYEWNRLDEAQTLVEEARKLNDLSRFLPLLGLELETSLLLHLARGEVEPARALLARLDRLNVGVHPDNLFQQQMFGVMAMNSRLALAAADPGAARLLSEVAGWIQARGLKPDDSFTYPLEGSYAVLARLLLLQGKPSEALGLLERLTEAAEAGGRKDDLLRYLLLQALAHHALAQEHRASEVLASEVLQRTLQLAEPQGYCRSFVDMGPVMKTLLEQVAKRNPTAHLTKLLAAFPKTESERLEATQVKTLSPRATTTKNKDWLEPLNERELTVLRLLSAGQTNKGIAKELRLSPNTVKWYVQGLYDKLGVSGRLQAVTRAKELGLF